ncbi:class I SAM-dependent methyltransferase [Flavivirga algicola]|uniref:Class I SAM-dependent methyltransferase n=1 Tax=Flavivirga algicola TaxID=2729136 RepID=A0ABX1S322_9FLAO|nr:class I SAM-dependent methyltransferase [Flavivirga algicola]NMH89473.1 class I SAM-dependent methyltransferase [Flavivirga algicola]
MAEKLNLDSKLTPKELAKHLRQPEGETGKEIGLQMNKGNKHICLNSYKVLNPKNKNHILEIGMGNGFFVKDLLKMADDLTYIGVDFSPIMVDEANFINEGLIKSGKVRFEQASIERLPFNDDTFDCITTTNTLYFWPQPQDNAEELLRVLKPGGTLLIAYRSKSFLNKLELSKHGFTKYEIADVENILIKSGFKQITTKTIKEPELDFDDTLFEMEGLFTTGIK